MKSRPGLAALLLVLFAAPGRADMADTIAKVKPSVVIVGTYKATDSPRFGMRGTGFVVARGPARGGNLVVTNAHVLLRSTQDGPDLAWVVQIRVAPDQLQTRAVTVLEIDTAHDLALLQLDGPPVPALEVGDSDLVREGQSVGFMGFPIGGVLGFSAVTHRAMISSIAAAALPTPTARQLNATTILGLREGHNFDIFQLDGTAYPGNSGGPLFDPDNGAVLGVLNMVLIKGTRESALTHPTGISYAIPSRFVKQLVQKAAER